MGIGIRDLIFLNLYDVNDDYTSLHDYKTPILAIYVLSAYSGASRLLEESFPLDNTHMKLLSRVPALH
jgi:alpha-D-ribose 1-methylphosphonate 5-triphosphate synthase subunit PhnI